MHFDDTADESKRDKSLLKVSSHGTSSAPIREWNQSRPTRHNTNL